VKQAWKASQNTPCETGLKSLPKHSLWNRPEKLAKTLPVKQAWKACQSWLSYLGPFVLLLTKTFFFYNNIISFIQMLATINTPKVQAPFGVSLLHLVLIIQGYNQNYMKLLSFPIFWSWRVHEGYSRKVLYLISISLLTACRIIFNSGSSVWLAYFAVIEIWNMLIYTKHKK
jgi:hypothetical protein